MDPAEFDIDDYMHNLRKEAHKSKRNYVFFCYASSHGEIRHGTTNIFMNEPDNYHYPIEHNLRTLKSKFPNIYVIGVLDMCREVVGRKPVHDKGGND